MRAFILSIILAIGSLSGFAQAVEQVYISVDREVYFAGDTLWYRPWIRASGTNAVDNLSRIVYLELISPQHEAVLQLKADLQTAHGAGCVLLPSSLQTGYFSLRAYTNRMRNLGTACYFSRNILVINPMKPALWENAGLNSGEITLHTQPADKQALMHAELTGVPHILQTREDVKAEIKLPADIQAQASQWCLSVAYKLQSPLSDAGIEKEPWNRTTLNKVQQSKLLPAETSCDYISGTLTEKDQAAIHKEVILSVPGDSQYVLAGITGPDGRIHFPISLLQGEREITLAMPDATDKALIGIENEFDAEILSSEELPLKADSTFIDALNSCYQAWQIRRNYGLEERLDAPPENKPFCFYGKPDFSIMLQEYAELPKLEEVFFELVPPVKVLGRKNEKKLQVIDRFTNRTLGENILFLVDGVPVFSHSRILEIAPSRIKRIEVLASKYYLGPKIFDGIISFVTRKGDYSAAEAQQNSVSRRVIFKSGPSPVYAYNKEAPHIPDYRTLVYWNAGIRPDADDLIRVSFQMPDLAGTYQLVLEGLSPTGKAVRFVFPLQVKTNTGRE